MKPLLESLEARLCAVLLSTPAQLTPARVAIVVYGDNPDIQADLDAFSAAHRIPTTPVYRCCPLGRPYASTNVSRIDMMLDEIRHVLQKYGGIPEKEMYKALMVEAGGWEMRLQELED